MKPKKEMVRKIINGFGQSKCRAVVLPKKWLDLLEQKSGKVPTHVRFKIDYILSMEILTIEPIFAPAKSSVLLDKLFHHAKRSR